eukprot:1030380-Prymnesium_polylepis.1
MLSEFCIDLQRSRRMPPPRTLGLMLERQCVAALLRQSLRCGQPFGPLRDKELVDVKVTGPQLDS